MSTPNGESGQDRRSVIRTVAAWLFTTVASLLVWFSLVAPNDIVDLTPGAFLRIPVEALIVVALAVILPTRARRVLAILVGLVLGLLTVMKVLDMGFFAALDRPFDPVSDWSYFGSAVDLLGDSIGRTGAIVSTTGAVLLAVAVVVLLPLAVLRLTRIAAEHRTSSIRSITAIGVFWVLSALVGLQVAPGASIASASAAGLAYDQLRQIRDGIQDQAAFERTTTNDSSANTGGADLLGGLHGKDVVIAFVESYGRVAVQDSEFSSGVDAVLDAGTARLRAAGFSSRSAFLTSPTFGGISWLAHSTLQSGLWIDNQQRYDQLVSSDRFTLSDAFRRGGWRTVGDVPSNEREWPEGTSFYHYNQIYDDGNVGYVGPTFGYASMPDQYTLSAFQRLELSRPARAPVMAEIDLVSSHTPWAPLPRLVDWNQVGDGSIFRGMPEQGQQPEDVWRQTSDVRAAYGQSIEYSLNTLVSFVENCGDPNLVLVVLGDHQPAAVVSGQGAGHDVPITVIAHDPAVTDRIAGWDWQDGMRPGPQAPVWPMDSFRDRFLDAFR